MAVVEIELRIFGDRMRDAETGADVHLRLCLLPRCYLFDRIAKPLAQQHVIRREVVVLGIRIGIIEPYSDVCDKSVELQFVLHETADPIWEYMIDHATGPGGHRRAVGSRVDVEIIIRELEACLNLVVEIKLAGEGEAHGGR